MRLQKNKVFLTVIFFACGIGAGCFCSNPAYAAGNDENLVSTLRMPKKKARSPLQKSGKTEN